KVKQKNPLQLTEEGINDIYQALFTLEEAERLFDNYKYDQPLPVEKLLEMERFLGIYYCIAKLLTAESQFVTEATEDMDIFTKNWNPDQQDVWKRRWDPNKKANFYLLYNLASWYGIADNVGCNVIDAKRSARRLITSILARNPEF